MNRFNLLEEAWIPVKGRTELIKICEIVHPDILGLDAPRADFNAALMQFLIGLLQTVFVPDTPRTWRNFYSNPPTETALQDKLNTIKEAFYLDGDGYRFMQDISIKDKGNHASILKLLPGLVGDNTVKKNMDFFVKSSQLSKISISNMVVGFYLYQNYCLSETGGSKARHHGSLRGRNSLIALVNKDKGNLWENIWLNVIQKNNFKNLIVNGTDNYVFEWMQSKTSEKQKTDNDIGLADIYWSMPRRVFVDFSKLKNQICDLTNKEVLIVENIRIKENGIEYKTNYIKHPLIPYRVAEITKKDLTGGVRPIKLKATGINYGDWLALIGNETASENLLEHVRRNLNGDFNIFVCGYLNDSTQAKTLCWYQTKMPFYLTSSSAEQKTELEAEVDKYIKVSKAVCDYLVVAIRNAWFDENDEKNKKQKESFNKDRAAEISKCFWNKTESAFYEIVKSLYVNSTQLTDDLKIQHRKDWYEHIKSETLKLFDEWAFKSSIQTNPRRISIAYNYRRQIESKGKSYLIDVGLINKLNSEFLKDIIGLPKEHDNE